MHKYWDSNLELRFENYSIVGKKISRYFLVAFPLTNNYSSKARCFVHKLKQRPIKRFKIVISNSFPTNETGVNLIQLRWYPNLDKDLRTSIILKQKTPKWATNLVAYNKEDSHRREIVNGKQRNKVGCDTWSNGSRIRVQILSW